MHFGHERSIPPSSNGELGFEVAKFMRRRSLHLGDDSVTAFASPASVHSD